MLLAGLIAAATLHGQTSQPAAASAIGTVPTTAAATTVSGTTTAAPAAVGSPGQSGSNGTRRSGRGRSARNSSGNSNGNTANKSQPPAPAANGDVQVTGFPAANASGTADRPLLPIASTGNGLGIPSGTPIVVRLRTAVDSGHAHNGDMLDGTLDAAVGNLPAGTPVKLTVVQAAPAGRISSYGQLSLQVVSIADRRVLSNTVTAIGKEGAKELPDAAPARGTEAVFTPDQPISLPAA